MSSRGSVMSLGETVIDTPKPEGVVRDDQVVLPGDAMASSGSAILPIEPETTIPGVAVVMRDRPMNSSESPIVWRKPEKTIADNRRAIRESAIVISSPETTSARSAMVSTERSIDLARLPSAR